MPDLIGVTLGPYRILEQIGLGGMATVYKAYQSGIDRLVALKVLPEHYARDPLFVQRFKQEAHIIAQLEHRNIVPVYDFGEQDGTTYLVMRYLQAGTVKDILAHGPLPLSDAARLVADVAAGLDYAHTQGIIHRDVKPSNILVDKQGHAYLTDFGLAKVLESTAELTSSGTLLGTPAYMAPEQTLGQPVTPQTDVYALGVVLYEMATGRPPYEADTPMAVALMHVHEPLPLPRQVNPALSKAVELVILKGLAKAPQDRYHSAGELSEALTWAVSTETPAPSTRLIELAEAVAVRKSEEEVTHKIRDEVRRQESTERRRRLLRLAPWVGAGLIIAALAVGLILLQSETTQVRGSAAQTATAVSDLSNQLSIAQTAVAGGGGAEFEATVQYLQTQLATTPTKIPAAMDTPSPTSLSTFTPTRTQTPRNPTPTHTTTLILVYSNNFERVAGSEWSNPSTSTTPNGRDFLGQFGNDAVTLTLNELPVHKEVVVAFDLFIIATWDGNRTDNNLGPDIWDLSVLNGPTLLHTTFGNGTPEISPYKQSYPGWYPDAEYAKRTGAAEYNTLGYPDPSGLTPIQDAVYRLRFEFDHSSSSLVLNFAGSGLQDISDESWGIDNITVWVQ